MKTNNKMRSEILLCRFITVFALLIVTECMVAQKQYVPLKCPAAYQKLPTGDVCVDCRSNPPSNLDWVVYSDRENNKSYTDASGSKELGKPIKFLQPFFVVEESGNYLHLIEWSGEGKEVKSGKEGKKLKKELQDYGWFHKDRLILWPSSLVNSRKVVIKVLSVIKDKEVIENTSKYIKEGEFLKFRNHPSDDDRFVNNWAMDMFEFLYVFKKENGYLLVAKKNVITGLSVDKVVLGWVSERVVTEWGDRLCLEPNSEPEAVEERKYKKLKAALLMDESSANKYSDDPKFIESAPNKVLWDNDPYEAGWGVNQKRLPILKNIDDNLMQTGYITGVLDRSGKEILNQEEDAKARRIDSERNAAIRNINIVFVVDGGSNMTDFFRNIQESIEKMVQDKQNMMEVQNQLRFGVVVYRDEADKNCPEGDFSIRTSKIADYNKAIEFLEKQQVIQGCNDSKPTQMVRNGLYEALKMLDESSKVDQTNYVILVGGAGDVETPADAKLSDASLAKMISKTKSNILVFQYANGMSKEFADFTGHARTLIMKGSEQMVVDLRETKSKGMFTDAVPDSRWAEDSDIDNFYRLSYEEGITARRGEITFPSYGQNLGSEVFSKTFDSLLNDIYVEIEDIIKELDRSINNETKKGEGLDPKILLYFTSIKNADSELLKKAYSPGNYQFFMECYTAMQPTGQDLDYPVFNRVLLFTADEFYFLTGQLKSLINESQDFSDRRMKLKEVLYDILGQYYGDSNIKEKAATMTVSEVLELISGVKPKSDLFNIRIDDITNKNKVSEDVINEMVTNKIDRKLKLLDGIKNDEKFRFESKETTCYWVPESYLP